MRKLREFTTSPAGWHAVAATDPRDTVASVGHPTEHGTQVDDDSPDHANPTARTLGLPQSITACLFDLDGVLTQTAKVHFVAWKEMFDAFLRARATRTGEPFRPFEAADYAAYVDGKLRHDGVRSFLTSRDIALAEGSEDDPPEVDTVHGLGTRKNDMVLAILERDGVEVYPASVTYLEACRRAGLRRALVTSSRNGHAVLRAAGLTDMFDAVVDGEVAAAKALAGKPAPDMFVEAATQVGVTPAQAAVFEDAVSGVAAGRAGGFGWVVGVDRMDQAAELSAHGADVVVADLSELTVAG